MTSGRRGADPLSGHLQPVIACDPVKDEPPGARCSFQITIPIRRTVVLYAHVQGITQVVWNLEAAGLPTQGPSLVNGQPLAHLHDNTPLQLLGEVS